MDSAGCVVAYDTSGTGAQCWLAFMMAAAMGSVM